jgi:outer membrane protein
MVARRPVRSPRPGSCTTALTALLSLSFAAVAHAEPMSRGGAIARALGNNPQIAARRAVEAQAEARRAQVDAARFPRVTLSLGVGPSLKAELVPGSAVQSTENAYGDVGLNDLSIVLGGQLEVLQPLYTFGKIDEREHATEHEIAARRAQTEMTRAELAVTVARLYESLLLARDAGLFLDETAHWLARSIEDAERELAANTGLREEDLLRLRAAMGAVRLGLNQARAGQRQAEAGLVAYLGLPRGSSIETKERGLEPLPAGDLSRSALIERSLKLRPELRALSEGGAAYRALANAEEAGNYPDFFALAFAYGAYTPGRDLVETRYVQDPLNGFYPGLIVGARWQVTGAMASKRADENQALAAELEQTRRWAVMGLPAEVTKAVEDVERARQDVEAADKAIEPAKKWLVMTSADFSIGLGDSRDLADAAQAYVQLRLALFDAKFRHNVALAELARATGTFNDASNGFYPTQEK